MYVKSINYTIKLIDIINVTLNINNTLHFINVFCFCDQLCIGKYVRRARRNLNYTGLSVYLRTD